MGKFILLLWVLTLSVPLRAQFEPQQQNDPFRDTNDNQPKGIVYHEEIPDSVLLPQVVRFHFTPYEVKILHSDHPLSDPTGWQWQDRLNAIDGTYYLRKSLIGQSHLNLYPTLAEGLQWRYQPDINRGYSKYTETVHLYQTQKPFATLAYQSSLKSEYQVHANFTQNILPRWNISFDYDLINPDEIFSNSAVKSHLLDFTTNYYSADSRYQGILGVVWNKQQMGENGGLSDDALFTTGQQTNMAGLPVVSYHAQSLYNDLTIFTHNSYNLVRQVERVREHYTLEVNPDDSTLLDTLYLYDTLSPAPCHVYNAGVLALDVQFERHSRRFTDTTFRDSTATFIYSGRIFWTNDAYPDYRWHNPLKITGGIEPRIVHINEHDSLTYNIYSVTPFARVQWHLWRGTLSGLGQYTFSGSTPGNDRRLEANYRIPIDSVRSIEASAVAEWKAPEFFYFHYHSNGFHWDQPDLDKISVQRFGMQYCHTGVWKVDLTAQHLLHNVWLDEQVRPHQSDGEAWLLQGRLMAHLRFFDWLCVDMQQMVQHSTNEEEVRVPTFASKNSIYADLQLFHRALHAQFGIDVRYHTLFYADAYNPAAGAFYRQNDIKVGNYLWGDVYINLQIKHASIYLKAGHLNAIWEQHPSYFLLPHYPGSQFGLYWGFKWSFFD